MSECATRDAVSAGVLVFDCRSLDRLTKMRARYVVAGE